MRARIFNETRSVELASDAEIAGSFLARLRGLLGRSELPQGAGLVIEPCSSVHGIGMRFAIDVVFLDRNNHVAYAMRLPRYGFSPIVRGARCAIELPQGTLQATRTARGDIVAIVPLSP
ncbi:MAG: DUF192 domain-containing protein [Thermaerobacter sp.]|nr:DUF192 domain-containing protein [Thermaerobacter sp.]